MLNSTEMNALPSILLPNVVIESDSWLLEGMISLLVWIAAHPLEMLTFTLVVATWYYARITARTHRVLADQ